MRLRILIAGLMVVGISVGTSELTIAGGATGSATPDAGAAAPPAQKPAAPGLGTPPASGFSKKGEGDSSEGHGSGGRNFQAPSGCQFRDNDLGLIT